MRWIMVRLLLMAALISGCGREAGVLKDLCLRGTNQDPDACSIMIEDIEENRKLLDGMQLDIRGFLVFGYHFMALYPTKDHAILDLTRSAVRVRTPHDQALREELIGYNNMAVRIIGTFVNDGRAGIPEWAGSIRIQRIGPVPAILEREVVPLVEYDDLPEPY